MYTEYTLNAGREDTMQVESHEDAHESEIPSLNESPCPSEASTSSSPSRRSDEVDDPKTVFLGGVPQDLDEPKIAELMSRFGSVEHVHLMRHTRKKSGEKKSDDFHPSHRGFCFVRFGTEEEAVKALEAGTLSAGEGESAMRIGEAEKGKARRSSNSGSASSGDQHSQEYRPGTVHAVAAAAAAAAAPYDPYAYYPHPGPVGYYDPYDPYTAQYAAQVHYAQAAQYAHAMQQAQHARYAAAMHSSLYGITPPASPTAARGGRWSPQRSPRGMGSAALRERQVFVGGLPRLTTESDMFRFFSCYGQIDDVKLVLDPRTGMSKRFGFITFADVANAEELKAKKVVNFGKGFMVNVGSVKKNQGAAASNDESESGSSQQMFKLGSESSADDLAAEMQSMVMEDDTSESQLGSSLTSSNSGSVLTTPRNSGNLDGKFTVSESPVSTLRGGGVQSGRIVMISKEINYTKASFIATDGGEFLRRIMDETGALVRIRVRRSKRTRRLAIEVRGETRVVDETWAKIDAEVELRSANSAPGGVGLQPDSRSSSIDPGSIDEELDEECQDATFLSLSPTAMDGFARPSPPRVRTKLTFEGAALAPPTSPTLMRSTSLPTPSASEMPMSPVKRALGRLRRLSDASDTSMTSDSSAPKRHSYDGGSRPPDSAVVAVEGIGVGTDADELHDFFSSFGNVLNTEVTVKLPNRDGDTKPSTPTAPVAFAFVQFEDCSTAREVKSQRNFVFNGQAIEVSSPDRYLTYQSSRNAHVPDRSKITPA